MQNFGWQRIKLSIATIFCAEQRGEETEEEKWEYEEKVKGKENTDEGMMKNKGRNGRE